ncbi:MAG: hypothetical protein WC741_03855 [Patescibacteria group bacterium]
MNPTAQKIIQGAGRIKEGVSSILRPIEKELKNTVTVLAPAFLGLATLPTRVVIDLASAAVGGKIGYFIGKKLNLEKKVVLLGPMVGTLIATAATLLSNNSNDLIIALTGGLSSTFFGIAAGISVATGQNKDTKGK